MFRKEFHSTQLSSSAVKHHYYEFHVKLKGKRLDFYTSTLTTQCFGCLSAMTKN